MPIKDIQSTKSVALPAAAAAALTAAIDLYSVQVGPVGSNIEVNLSIEAVPNLVDAKTITLDLYHCDTLAGSYTVVPTVGNMVVTGAGGVGAAATKFRFYFPPETKRFIKGRAAVLTAGGDNTAKTLTLALVV